MADTHPIIMLDKLWPLRISGSQIPMPYDPIVKLNVIPVRIRTRTSLSAASKSFFGFSCFSDASAEVNASRSTVVSHVASLGSYASSQRHATPRNAAGSPKTINIHCQPAMPPIPSIARRDTAAGPPTTDDRGVAAMNQAKTLVRDCVGYQIERNQMTPGKKPASK